MTPFRHRALGAGLEVTVPILLLVLWGVWSSHAGSFYFPPLTEILRKFQQIWIFDRVPTDVVPSLVRLSIGYGIAVIIAVGVGIPLGLSNTARRAVSPIVDFLRSIPSPALIPFAIAVIGIGTNMKIFIIALVCIWPVLMNTIDGVIGIDPVLKDTARVFRIRGLQRIWHVVLPAASPQIFAGMRTSLALALIMMVISEMAASTEGIGYFVLQSQRSFAIPEMWSGILLLGLLGYGLNFLFVIIENRALAWHRSARASALR